MKHGLKITRDVISQQSKHLDNKLHKLLFKKLGNLVKYYDLNKPMGEPYVACFSKRGDQLGQWRAYGARGLGYSIQLKPIFTSIENPFCGFILHKVVYDKVTQKSHVTEVLPLLVDYFEFLMSKLPISSIPDPIPFDWLEQHIRNDSTDDPLRWEEPAGAILYNLEGLCISACIALESLQPRLKDAGFREEDEWRIIHNAGKPANNSRASIQFRPTNGQLVPYVELPFLKEFDAVTPLPHQIACKVPPPFEVAGVTCGPCPHPQMTKRSTEMFLESIGLGHVPVVSSKIPYRSW